MVARLICIPEKKTQRNDARGPIPSSSAVVVGRTCRSKFFLFFRGRHRKNNNYVRLIFFFFCESPPHAGFTVGGNAVTL